MKNKYGNYYLSETDKEYRRKDIAPFSVWEKRDVERKIRELNKFSDEQIEVFMNYSSDCVKKVFLYCYSFDKKTGQKYFYFYPLNERFSYEHFIDTLESTRKKLTEERKTKKTEPIYKVVATFKEWNSWTNSFDYYDYDGYKKGNWMYPDAECTGKRKKLFTKYMTNIVILEDQYVSNEKRR